MAIDYANMQDVATRLLTENGKDFSARRYSGGTTNADGSDSQGAPTAFTVTGVTVPRSESQFNSSTVLAGDIILRIEAKKAVLEMGDQVQVDGKWLAVVDIDTQKPADIALAYFIQLRA